MTLTAEFDLQGLGPTQGRPVAQHWSWTDHLWTLLPLGLLVLPFRFRRNRHRGTAAVLIPTLALYFLWIPLSGVVGTGIGRFESMLATFAVGLGTLCLTLPWIATGSRLRTWLLSLLVVLVAEFLTLLCFSSGVFDVLSFDGPQVVLPVAASTILVTGVVLATRAGRGRLGGVAFVPLLMLWLVVVTPVAVLGTVMLVEGPAIVLDSPRDLFEILAASLAIAAASFALCVPFLLLAAFSATYRERFRAAFARG